MRTRNLGILTVLSLFLWAAIPRVAAQEADYTFTTNNGTITITWYTGPGGVVTIPDMFNGLPVTSIGDYAFGYRSSMTSITIPNSVISIGFRAFFGCPVLTSITIPNSVTNIGGEAFAGCSSLTNIMIPNSVTSIRQAAFSFCYSLTSVTIGNSVTNIEDYVFSYCRSLTGVYFHGDAPNATPILFEDRFYHSTNVTVYYLPGTTGWGTTFSGRPTAVWKPQVASGDLAFGVKTNQFGFNITWANDKVVVVEASTNLANPTWAPVATNTLSGGTNYFSDPQWMNYPTRFYRIRSP